MGNLISRRVRVWRIPAVSDRGGVAPRKDGTRVNARDAGPEGPRGGWTLLGDTAGLSRLEFRRISRLSGYL